MSEEQLEKYNAARRDHYRVMGNRNSQTFRARLRVELGDEEYKRRVTKTKMRWTALNHERSLELRRNSCNAAIAANKFPCAVCKISLQSRLALDKHLKSKAHAEQERLSKGGKPKKPSEAALTARSIVARNRELALHSCKVCDKSFNNRGHLKKHLKSKKHAKRELALLAAAAASS
ncbi:hypothetical protein SBRCBS47491_000804 [Sporothrix bragantina]|uniref:C2H2-type domain-containing protein n=1 Tax=Sporothrix bragantina TaxID=671064 RepID=A0ABP0ATC3_9PEZI